MSIALNSYFLFDGALLHDSALQSFLFEAPEICELYEDEGPLAARVGPLLLPANREVAREINRLAPGHSDMAFGYSLLRSPARLEQVSRHLRHLRFVQDAGERRYYFRFADGRAFANVWQALCQEQRQAVLGPVREWHYHDIVGRALCARAESLSPSNHASVLPLRLQPEQWHRVLSATRVGELFLAASQIDHGLPVRGTHVQRYAWTTQVHERLQQLRVHDMSVRVAAVLVVWQTAARVLRQDLFEAALKEANGSGDIDRVLAFGHSKSERLT